MSETMIIIIIIIITITIIIIILVLIILVLIMLGENVLKSLNSLTGGTGRNFT